MLNTSYSGQKQMLTLANMSSPLKSSTSQDLGIASAILALVGNQGMA